jgi:hypothetical protein
VALAQADTALLPPCAIALGNALRARHDHAGAAADLDAGRAAFDLAIRQGADWAPLEALRAATTWGTWAAGVGRGGGGL